MTFYHKTTLEPSRDQKGKRYLPSRIPNPETPRLNLQ
jgi:hypothetical protein